MRERPRFLRDWANPSQPGRGVVSLLALLGAGGLLFLALQGWWVLTPAVALRSGPQVVEIPAHSGIMEITRILDEGGVIRSPVGFMLLSVARGRVRNLKAGEYQIPRGANTVTVLSMLQGGQVLQHNIVFREGSTLQELSHLLAAEGLAK